MIYLIFLLGLFIGSFLNVCIYRIPKGKSIAYPPSHCPKCGENLRPWDLIPILSFISTKGKCRYCEEAISLQYPIIELFNGLIYLLLYLKYGLTIVFVKYAILASLLLIISIIDYKIQIIPDGCNLFGLIGSGIFVVLSGFDYSSWIDAGLGLFVGGGIFLFIAIATNGAMGGGDIKLMGVLGFAFGWKYILLISLLSFIIGSIISIFLLLFKLKHRKDPIAFGPFISIAAFMTMLYGNEMIHWYILNIIR
ncbi:MAG: prepilin peptidase [Marinisporobacter sp.]|jgi:leader peptidase (prepilin peptidase)/N-methyltransferase|nr:prepilin peptidase [Marinisporobacter sp.]